MYVCIVDGLLLFKVDQRQQGETLPSLATAGDVKNGDLGTLFANLN